MTLYMRDQENIELGKSVKLVSLVRKKWLKGISAENIADMLEEDVKIIKRIIDILNTRDLSDEEIIQVLMENDN